MSSRTFSLYELVIIWIACFTLPAAISVLLLGKLERDFYLTLAGMSLLIVIILVTKTIDVRDWGNVRNERRKQIR